MLENGDNGSFGDAPFGTKEYEEALCWFFYPTPVSPFADLQAKHDYEGSDQIFDLDDYTVAAVIDANYPDNVKEAIANLVTFREDCFFFRDMGLDIDSYASIMNKKYNSKINNRYIGDYLTTYQIYDPNTYKRIRVTAMYDLAAALVGHFINGPFRPLAGTVNSMILTSAIEGTVNYTPRITPTVNQKSLLEDARVNYAIFQQGQCVLQSLYTSQEAYTQLSYINNVLAIQQVARAVRIACPKHRYTLVKGFDFSSYEDSVNQVLRNYSMNFQELTFEYQVDPLMSVQKIFYAVLGFRFNNWAQTEIFELYALPVLDE